jgi:hypothetical protein
MRNRGGSPTEVDDVARLAGIQLDIVANPNLAGQRHENAGEEVRQWLLQRERHRQTANAEGGEHRCNRQTEPIQDHEQPHYGHQRPGDVVRQTADRQGRRDDLTVGVHEPAANRGGGDGDRQGDEYEYPPSDEETSFRG